MLGARLRPWRFLLAIRCFQRRKLAQKLALSHCTGFVQPSCSLRAAFVQPKLVLKNKPRNLLKLRGLWCPGQGRHHCPRYCDP